MVIKAGYSQTNDVNSDKSDLAKDQVSESIALEKGGGRIFGEREERHPFCCLFVLYPVQTVY